VLPGRNTLLDASALVALLDTGDQWHDAARPEAPRLPRCLTTEAVLVESSHLLMKRRIDPGLALEFLLGVDIPIVAIHRPLHEDCLVLMRRYARVPMDYADATLVALAERLQIRQVFTFDRRGFRQYRGVQGGAPLLILPG
jgi:predicted nucleic acid-binding protein